jgi:hypothetical protein
MNNPRKSISGDTVQVRAISFNIIRSMFVCSVLATYARKVYMYSFCQIYEECKLLLLVLTGERPCVIRSNYNHCCV